MRSIKTRGGEVRRCVQKVKMIAGKEKRGEDTGESRWRSVVFCQLTAPTLQKVNFLML